MIALLAAAALAASGFVRPDGTHLTPARIDAVVEAARAASATPGVAVALIRDGKVAYVHAYGLASKSPPRALGPNTVMYGASITKAVFADYVMQLVDRGLVDLDAPIAKLLPKPLPAFAKYKDLEGDERWRRITPRMLLTHSSGFANFAWLEPDGKLSFHFEPGSRYAYSGQGINLLQLAIEAGFESDLGVELQRHVFGPLGMTRTALTWGTDFASDVSDGYDDKGAQRPHDRRGSTGAAGSMDTTITDLAKWVAAVSTGWGLTPQSADEMWRPQLPITAAHQFPTLVEGPNADRNRAQLQAALGWLAFDGPLGPGVYKGGHDEQTDNSLVCLKRSRSCLLILTNSGVGARMFPTLLRALLGETGLPWAWEYNPVLPLTPAP